MNTREETDRRALQARPARNERCTVFMFPVEKTRFGSESLVWFICICIRVSTLLAGFLGAPQLTKSDPSNTNFKDPSPFVIRIRSKSHPSDDECFQ